MTIISFSLEQLKELPSNVFEPLPLKIDPSSKELVPSWRLTKDRCRLDLNTVYMTRLQPLNEVTFYIFRRGKKENAPSFIGGGRFKVSSSELGIRVQCKVPRRYRKRVKEIEELRKTNLCFLQIKLIVNLVESYYIDVHEMIRGHFMQQHCTENLPLLRPKRSSSAWEHRIDQHPFHLVNLSS